MQRWMSSEQNNKAIIWEGKKRVWVLTWFEVHVGQTIIANTLMRTHIAHARTEAFKQRREATICRWEKEKAEKNGKEKKKARGNFAFFEYPENVSKHMCVCAYEAQINMYTTEWHMAGEITYRDRWRRQRQYGHIRVQDGRIYTTPHIPPFH